MDQKDNLESSSDSRRAGTVSEISRAVLLGEARRWLGILLYQKQTCLSLSFFAAKHNSVSNKGGPVNLYLS